MYVYCICKTKLNAILALDYIPYSNFTIIFDTKFPLRSNYLDPESLSSLETDSPRQSSIYSVMHILMPIPCITSPRFLYWGTLRACLPLTSDSLLQIREQGDIYQNKRFVFNKHTQTFLFRLELRLDSSIGRTLLHKVTPHDHTTVEVYSIVRRALTRGTWGILGSSPSLICNYFCDFHIILE